MNYSKVLMFNEDDSLSLYVFGDWNISFWQKYDPSGSYYARNFTLAKWFIKKVNDSLYINMFFNHTYYLLLPTYMPINKPPILGYLSLISGMSLVIIATAIIIIEKKLALS